ncbi:MAG: lipoate--protein ligase [Desulfobacterales bacterium]
MIFQIDNNNTSDPHVNIAIEECVLRHLDPDRTYFLMYVNRPSIIVGRHQNILEEVNLPFAARHGLPVLRRISGGGAVYHDCGNLNFSFIRHHDRRSLKDVSHILEPVRSALLKLGVVAEFNHKNDLFVAGKKISGNAQFSNTKRIILHGTLLLNSDLVSLRRALQANQGRIISRARQSVPSDVTNISDHLPSDIGMDVFQQHLVECIAEREGGLQKIPLPDREWNSVRRLSREKYRSWEWNFGKAPAFRIRRRSRTPAGYLETMIAVESGCIINIRFEKNINAIDHAVQLEKRLMGTPYHLDAIRTRLSGVDVRRFGTTLTANQLAEHLCDNGISGIDPGLQSARRILS